MRKYTKSVLGHFLFAQFVPFSLRNAFGVSPEKLGWRFAERMVFPTQMDRFGIFPARLERTAVCFVILESDNYSAKIDIINMCNVQ
jgi:hypothetical protein